MLMEWSDEENIYQKENARLGERAFFVEKNCAISFKLLLNLYMLLNLS